MSSPSEYPSGVQAWVASRSDSKASADIRIYVNTWRK